MVASLTLTDIAILVNLTVVSGAALTSGIVDPSEQGGETELVLLGAERYIIITPAGICGRATPSVVNTIWTRPQ